MPCKGTNTTNAYTIWIICGRVFYRAATELAVPISIPYSTLPTAFSDLPSSLLSVLPRLEHLAPVLMTIDTWRLRGGGRCRFIHSLTATDCASLYFLCEKSIQTIAIGNQTNNTSIVIYWSVSKGYHRTEAYSALCDISYALQSNSISYRTLSTASPVPSVIHQAVRDHFALDLN